MAGQSPRRSETELIAHYFAPLCSDEAAFGLSDDTAFLTPPDGHDLVLTKDMLIADVHFFADDQPEDIAAKALRVNLSDLAAKGAKPVGYMLGLGLPLDWSESWLARFCEGLKTDQACFNFPLLGGDTVKCPERLTLSITAFGAVPRGKRPLRMYAKPGDALYVTGTIGDGALGLETRKGLFVDDVSRIHHDFLTNRFLIPEPRLEAAQVIENYVSAAMDISDGLTGDAGKMANAADVSLVIREENVPLSDAAQALIAQKPELLHMALVGGDDYELLLAVSPDKQAPFEAASNTLPYPMTLIGQVEEGQGVCLIKSDGRRIKTGSDSAYVHF